MADFERGVADVLRFVVDDYPRDSGRLPCRRRGVGGLEYVHGYAQLAAYTDALASVYLAREFDRYRFTLWLTRREVQERRRAEQLLRNVLPDAIIPRLKGGEQPIADQFADVTVIFIDIVDFTPLSERLGPARMVTLLKPIHLERSQLPEEVVDSRGRIVARRPAKYAPPLRPAAPTCP